MVAKSVITVTAGEAGSGKTYARCARFLIERFLPDGDGVHWSNFPLGAVPEGHAYPPAFEGETFADRIAVEAGKRMGVAPSEILARVQVIPREELQRWERGESGPWDFFDSRDISGAHIAIDEVHNFLDPQGKGSVRQRWRQWLGEIRHRGATVEFISQNLAKVPMDLRREAGLYLEVKNTNTERDPFFRIELADWYELRAAWVTGRYQSSVIETEYRSAVGNKGPRNFRRSWALDPWWFQFYDSFSAPQKGGTSGKAARYQFQRRGRVGVLLWFLGKNLSRLAPKVALALFVLWLAFGSLVGLGGGRWLVSRAIARAQGVALRSSGIAAKEEPAPSARGDAVLVAAGVGAPERVVVSADPKLADELLEAARQVAGEFGGVPPADVIRAVLAIRREKAAVEAENERLRSEMLPESVAMFRLDGVALSSGGFFRVGETIDVGPHQGKVLDAIDWDKRRAVLDDGTVLRPADVGASRAGGGGLAGVRVPIVGR